VEEDDPELEKYWEVAAESREATSVADAEDASEACVGATVAFADGNLRRRGSIFSSSLYVGLNEGFSGREISRKGGRTGGTATGWRTWDCSSITG